MCHVQDLEEQESMRILRGLALELQYMDDSQRLKTLKWVVQKETAREGNRLWLIIVKILLVRPELIPRALELSMSKTAETNPNTYDIKMNIEQLTNNQNNNYNKKFLNNFFQETILKEVLILKRK